MVTYLSIAYATLMIVLMLMVASYFMEKRGHRRGYRCAERDFLCQRRFDERFSTVSHRDVVIAACQIHHEHAAEIIEANRKKGGGKAPAPAPRNQVAHRAPG